MKSKKARLRDRPNFILFMTDQQQANMLGCYGHPVVRTPNIDRIAGKGTLFSRFYVATPSCMPNRASVMTGRMPSVHGVRVNGIPLPKNTNTFVDLLKADGYQTALVGKGHLQPMVDRPPLGGCTEEFIIHRPGGRRLAEARSQTGTSWNTAELNHGKIKKRGQSYYGYEQVELCTGHGDICGADYETWLLQRDPDGLKKMGPEAARRHSYTCPQAWRTALPAKHYPTSFVADRAVAFLKERQNADDDRPFFLCVSFPDPHHPFTPPGKYWGMYDPDDIELPANFSGGNRPPPHLKAAYEEHINGTANLEGFGAVKLTKREAREAIALTCGMITMVDNAIGAVVKALKSSNLTEQTVVAFTSDHGDLLGDHGLMLKGPLHYQSLIRVPFVWSDPAHCAARESDFLGSSMDIPATILDRAGIAPYNGMQGLSLMDVLNGGKPDRPGLLIEDEQQGPVLSFDQATRVRTLVTRRYRMSIFTAATWGELYDLEADPGELENLWDDPVSARVKAVLLEKLSRLMMQSDDNSPRPMRLA